MNGDFDFDAFVTGYIECAMFADCMPPENDPEGESGGRNHLELREGVRETMIERGQLADFVNCHLDDLLAYCVEMGTWHGRTDSLGNDSYTPEQCAGHDYWYTRSGHGTGFWDRGLGELGERLADAARAYGSTDDHAPYDCGDGTADV